MARYRRVQELTGLPVVQMPDGVIVGQAEGAQWNPGSRYIDGIYFRGTGAYRKKAYAARQDIVLLGAASILVNRSAAGNKPPAKPPGEQGWPLKVVDSAGEELGTLSGLLVESHSCRVYALEVSEGLLADIQKGYAIIRYFGLLPDRKNLIAVTQEEEKTMRKKGGELYEV
ncbi:hypothetical protein [Luoshenia tenuis]|uniref:hypothetical protein n=1 Tax=Luoshenia tenuis TaxID=2763654 RepID=UPI003D8ACDD3